MKSWTIFILAVGALLTQPTDSQACGYWDNHADYNLFRCVEPLPRAKEAQFNETLQFWANYIGQEADELYGSICWMELSTFDQLDDKGSNNSDNLLLKTLKEKKDSQAIEFLRLNELLSSYINGSDGWEYKRVTLQDYQNLLQKIVNLQVPSALSQRKTFLQMRCLFQMRQFDECLALWEKVTSRWADSPLRNRVEGYVAGVYFAREEYAKAADMYFRLGDDESISLCVNRLLSTSNAEEEYRRDPNSRLLGYLLEDYANYFYHAVQHDITHLPQDEHPIWSTVWGESRKMEQFALRVVKEGKAKDLKMWQTFAGFLQLMRGESRQALATLTTAEPLAGNEIVQSLLRHYLLMAKLDTQRPNADFDKYLGAELRYYQRREFSSDLEADVLSNLYDYELSNRIDQYIQKKMDSRLPLFFAQSIYGSWRYNAVLEMSDHLTTDEVRQVRQVIETQECKDSLVAALLPTCTLTTGCLNEVLGTKLMREGKFAEAEDYLFMVSANYMNGLGIAPYLASRSPSKVPFTRKDYKDPEVTDLNHNAKFDYCRQVLQLQKEIAECSEMEERHRLQYKLADLYFQASPAGDLWAISEYGIGSTTDSLSNGLNLLADKLIHQILAETKDKSMQIRCHYALAANPAHGAVPCLRRNWEDSSVKLTASKEGNLQAYQWLQQNQDPDHPVFESCDWLKLYVVEQTKDDSWWW